MVFRLAKTFTDPGSSQAGFPSPGSGAQTTGKGTPAPRFVARTPVRPTAGVRSWLVPSRTQRGFPAPGAAGQGRPPGWTTNEVPFGGAYQNYTKPYDRGAAAYVPNFGSVHYNPIGAGIFAPYRPRAYYNQPGQYANGMIFWTSQAIPTSINLQGLTDPAALAQILDSVQIQSVVRTTG